MHAVANAVTACAVDPEAAFDWINRTEDDDVDFEELAINAPEFTSLDAKLRAALTKFAPGEGDRPKEVMQAILARSEELKQAMPKKQIKGDRLSY